MEDPKVIAACVKSLESSLSLVGVKLAIATGAVVFGLVIEYWDDAKKAFFAIVNCIKFRRLSDWNALERHVRTAVIGGLFITIGVGAELLYEHRANVLEGQLETENGLLIANLNDKASASEERAKKLENSTQQLRTDADTQRGIAAGALQKAGEANATAEREKVQEAQLGLLVSPRRLTLKQQEKIGKACSGMNRIPVSVGEYGMDSEGRALANQIAYAIFDRTFNVTFGQGGPITSGALDEGVIISGPEIADRFTACLAGALTNIGKLKDVKVNGTRNVGGASMTGNANMTGNASMTGGSSTQPAGPLPPGSAIQIFVGVKPIELLELKK
jgi:hypothetical protein